LNPAPSRAHEAVGDIGAVVDHLRAPHGVDQVDLVGWSWGGTTAGFFASLWSASSITTATPVIVGDRDPVAPLDHAEALMRDPTHSRGPKHVVLNGATHFAQYEAGRTELFEADDALLRDTSRGSQTKGR
jgi:pimeloyl-ACP methyl ester carboxylesterase